MIDPSLAATMTLAAVLILVPLAGWLHLRLRDRLDTLEGRLRESAEARAETLGAAFGEALAAERPADEALRVEIARLRREIERLGADILNRELYRGDKPRHGDAIAAVRDGGDVHSLVREHGLPLEEAELLVSLYAHADRAPAEVD